MYMYVYSCMQHIHVRLQLKQHVHVRLQLDATRRIRATSRRHTNYTQLNFGAERIHAYNHHQTPSADATLRTCTCT